MVEYKVKYFAEGNKMLNIITGRISSGKTTQLIDDIGERIKDKRKSVLIVPDQVTYNFEHRLCTQLNIGGFIDVEVCSFNRLASAVCDFCGKNKKTFLDDCGKAMVMRLCVLRAEKELTVFNKASSRKGFTERCMNMISTLENCNYSYENIIETADKLEDGLLKDKLRDIAAIYKEYIRVLDSGYTDNADRLKCAQELLFEYSPLRESRVYIDGFDVFTSRLYAFISEIMRLTDVTVALSSAERGSDGEAYEIHKKTLDTLIELAGKNRIEYKVEHVEGMRSNKSKEILFLENAFYAFPQPVFEEECANIKINSYKAYVDEVTAVAENIARGVRNGRRYKNYAVLCNDLNTYTPIVQSVFSRYDIPVYASVKHDITSHPIAMYLISLLKCAAGDFSPKNVTRLVLSTFSPLDPDETDRFISLIKSLDIKKYDIETGMRFKRGSDVQQTDFERLREKLMTPISEVTSKLCACKNARDISACCYSFLESAEIYEKADALVDAYEAEKLYALSDITAQMWNITVKLLNDIAAFLGERTVTVDEYASILREGFDAAPASTIPSVLDCVTFGDLGAAREENTDITFVIGANEGVIPAANMDERIVTIDESDILTQKGMELAHTPDTEDARMRFGIYSAFCSPAEQLYISYSTASHTDEPLLPSPLIGRMTRLFPKLKTEYVTADFVKTVLKAPMSQKQSMLATAADRLTSEESRALYELLRARSGFGLTDFEKTETKISRELASKLFAPENAESITKLEKFAKCPFSHFVMHGLKPEILTEYSTTDIDIGNLFHETLEEYVRRTFAHPECKKISQTESRELSNKIFDEKLPNIRFGVMESTKRQIILNKSLKKLIALCAWRISESLKDFTPIGEEISFGYGKNRPISIETEYGTLTFKGKIDRADKLEKDGKVYLRVIDYKSGKKAVSKTAEDNIQLLMYMKALLAKFGNNAVPDSVSYVNLTDDEKLFTSTLGASALLGKNGFGGMIDKAYDAAKELARGILSGDIAAEPRKDACRYCECSKICGYGNKKGEAESNGEEDALMDN